MVIAGVALLVIVVMSWLTMRSVTRPVGRSRWPSTRWPPVT